MNRRLRLPLYVRKPRGPLPRPWPTGIDLSELYAMDDEAAALRELEHLSPDAARAVRTMLAHMHDTAHTRFGLITESPDGDYIPCRQCAAQLPVLWDVDDSG